MNTRAAAWVAWLLSVTYYFYQYALRSAPAVMMPQLSDAFDLSAMQVASLVSVFYYGYSIFSLVAGAALDRLGVKAVIPTGALIMACGALLFGMGTLGTANLGRFCQGAGGVFAFVGSVYLVTKNFPASQAATLVGATQMFGMAGGSAGQFLVGPMITAGMPWNRFWIGASVVGFLIAGALFVMLPGNKGASRPGGGLKAILAAVGLVFRNPQSILCGMIGGLLFIPTTILDMIWGVRFLQEAHGFDYGEAVMRSAMVPLGWIVGCPLLGMLSDRLGRRKPVIVGGACVLLACLAWILYGRPGVIPPYVVGFLAGVGSGAAMLPCTIIKEANPPELGGTATGVVSFLIFTFSALLGPVFARLLQNASGGGQMTLEHYQAAFQPMLYGVAAAIALTLVLKETGKAAHPPLATAKTV